MAPRTDLHIRSGKTSVTLRFLCSRQRLIRARSPKMSVSARRNALAPSITNSNLRSVGSPRSIRSASSALHGGVLGCFFAQAQHVFFAADIDADCGQHPVIGEAYPLDHHGDQLKPVEFALHQRRELFSGADRERLTRHALADARDSDIVGQRFQQVRIAAGRDSHSICSIARCSKGSRALHARQLGKGSSWPSTLRTRARSTSKRRRINPVSISSSEAPLLKLPPRFHTASSSSHQPVCQFSYRSENR
jgi:hypothetical protein